MPDEPLTLASCLRVLATSVPGSRGRQAACTVPGKLGAFAGFSAEDLAKIQGLRGGYSPLAHEPKDLSMWVN
ncbi:hypothetical protein [Candidatus Cyanaurora vandensis]|uniref:hypothetical protein n=1 Tax=Candidatus Cyanaurora vandensis TaxID=2714958 RepID=UPI00257BCE70|nr:hypothetical protein [Candidatus Cyanaurora vandensis]